jgi:hypothetical protein
MKFTPTKIILLTAIGLAGNFSAAAQSNAPGDTDYAKFSSFITDRNIFDPNRYPHNARSAPMKTKRTPRTRAPGTPFIALVGTMSYEKGLFAFFNANDSDLKKILTAGDEIAGYTVKEITASVVTLTDKDKKEITMKIGDQMHQDGSAWKLNDESSGNAPASEAPPTTELDNSSATGTTEAPAAAPSANLEGNDILKKLMEKRAKENQ